MRRQHFHLHPTLTESIVGILGGVLSSNISPSKLDIDLHPLESVTSIDTSPYHDKCKSHRYKSLVQLQCMH